MIEDNETPVPEPPKGGIEHDLLAKRRARRAELNDPALMRRAEAAEATVRTLEAHISSVKQQLEEATDEQKQLSAQLSERELEVRRVKQREYAEQQLRHEIEERLERQGREKQAEVQDLQRRLNISERHARELAQELDNVRRELAKARQGSVPAERLAPHQEAQFAAREEELEQRQTQLEEAKVKIEQHLSAARDFERQVKALSEQSQARERALAARLAELELRAGELGRETDRQRMAREHAELTLSRAQQGRSGLIGIVHELGQAVNELRSAIDLERAALEDELARKQDELGSRHAAELERQREELLASHEVELERVRREGEGDVAAQVEALGSRHAAELERQREELLASHEAELERVQRESAHNARAQRDALTHEQAARIEHVNQLNLERQRQGEQLRSEYEGKLDLMRIRVGELERELEHTTAKLRSFEEVASTATPPVSHAYTEVAEETHKREMTEALASAVERLRARATMSEESSEYPDSPGQEAEGAASAASLPVTETSESHDAAHHLAITQAEPATASPTEGLGFRPRVLGRPNDPPSWLAPAIRRVAERTDAKLAGELIVELLSAQRLVIDQPLSYIVEIEGVGSFRVNLDGDRSTIEKLKPDENTGQPAFVLKGQAASFSELAAGGARHRMKGIKVHGSKRQARRLLKARRPPLVLSEVANAGMSVWPGLLLLALGVAIDSEWTRGHKFVVAFAIVGEPSVITIYVHVNDGEPLMVSRTCEQQVSTVVQLSERSLTCLLAAVPIPKDEMVLTDGDVQALQTLIAWSDRAQGLGVHV